MCKPKQSARGCTLTLTTECDIREGEGRQTGLLLLLLPVPFQRQLRGLAGRRGWTTLWEHPCVCARMRLSVFVHKRANFCTYVCACVYVHECMRTRVCDCSQAWLAKGDRPSAMVAHPIAGMVSGLSSGNNSGVMRPQRKPPCLLPAVASSLIAPAAAPTQRLVSCFHPLVYPSCSYPTASTPHSQCPAAAPACLLQPQNPSPLPAQSRTQCRRWSRPGDAAGPRTPAQACKAAVMRAAARASGAGGNAGVSPKPAQGMVPVLSAQLHLAQSTHEI